MDLGLEDVHVLVTGASGGIGYETVVTFLSEAKSADQGAIVTAQFNSSARALENLTPDPTIQALKCDLTDEHGVIQLFDNALRTFGPVQILVVNHAIYEPKDTFLWDMSLDQWKKTLDTNLTSSFLVTREYLRRLKDAPEDKKSDASVIMIGSTAGKYGEAGHADYAASKSAMMYGLTMSLKNEIVKTAPKARVNSVAPGWVKTPMAEGPLKNPKIAYAALASTPLKKVATPQDIANQVIILASNKVSGHVTGQVLMVEGGMEGRVLNSPDDLGLVLE